MTLIRTERLRRARHRLPGVRRLSAQGAGLPRARDGLPGVRRLSAQSGMSRLRVQSGQSSVELIAMLPLALVVGFAIMSLLAARSAAGQAAAAAHAGAMALIQDADASDAARAALPAPARARAEISVRGRRVEVTVRPPAQLPFLDGALASTAAANAGPEPSP